MWRYLTITYLLFVSVLWITSYSSRTGKAVEPPWAVELGWLFSALTIVPLPIVALVVWCRMGDSGVAAILSIKPLPLWGPVLEENRTGRYDEGEKAKDEGTLLDEIETRVIKKDRMKKAKMQKGRYSSGSAIRTTDFDMESHDGKNLVRYHPPKASVKKATKAASKTSVNEAQA